MADFAQQTVHRCFGAAAGLFDVGGSIEEVLLLRAIYNYACMRFGVAEPCKRRGDNPFVNLCYDDAWDMAKSQAKRVDAIGRMAVADQPALGLDHFARRAATLYAARQQQPRGGVTEVRIKAAAQDLLATGRCRVCEVVAPVTE